jgi:hypothetical protein
VGENSLFVHCKKFSSKKGSARRYIVVMQQKIYLLPKFRAKSSHIFTKSQQNFTIVCVIDSLACRSELFVNTLLMSKKMMSMLLTLLFTYLSFSVSVSLDSLCTAHVPSHFFPKFAQNLMLFLCRIHREISSGQIHDC